MAGGARSGDKIEQERGEGESDSLHSVKKLDICTGTEMSRSIKMRNMSGGQDNSSQEG